jgi:AcrR family transcriptional regulator
MSVLNPRSRRTSSGAERRAPSRDSRRRTYLPAEARRAQILDIAKGVFARRGYQRANIDDICKAARIARGTLYQYFENKDGVLAAILDDTAARIHGVLEARAPIAVPLPSAAVELAAVERFCRARLRQMLDAVFADEATLRLVFREARTTGAGSAMIARALRRIDELVLTALEADLAAAIHAGVVKPMPRARLRLVALFILGGIEKMVLTSLEADDRVDIDAIVETAVDLELSGLYTPPPPTTDNRRRARRGGSGA